MDTLFVKFVIEKNFKFYELFLEPELTSALKSVIKSTSEKANHKLLRKLISITNLWHHHIINNKTSYPCRLPKSVRNLDKLLHEEDKYNKVNTRLRRIGFFVSNCFPS